jgi:hypothetical protein
MILANVVDAIDVDDAIERLDTLKLSFKLDSNSHQQLGGA